MSVEDLPAKKSSGTDYTDWRTQRHPPISSSRLSELDQGFPTVGEDYSYTERYRIGTAKRQLTM